MTSETDNAPQSTRAMRPMLLAMGWRLARLVYAWLLALYLIALLELGWSAGFREVYAHVRSEPQLATAVALAVLCGWFAATPASKPGQSWIYRHPLFVQALVGAALALGAIAVLLR
jgi:hypothetical protein